MTQDDRLLVIMLWTGLILLQHKCKHNISYVFNVLSVNKRICFSNVSSWDLSWTYSYSYSTNIQISPHITYGCISNTHFIFHYEVQLRFPCNIMIWLFACETPYIGIKCPRFLWLIYWLCITMCIHKIFQFEYRVCISFTYILVSIA